MGITENSTIFNFVGGLFPAFRWGMNRPTPYRIPREARLLQDGEDVTNLSHWVLVNLGCFDLSLAEVPDVDKYADKQYCYDFNK